MLQKLSFLFLALITFSGALYAEVQLPAIFGNGMVLQRNAEVAFWGTAEKNSTVEITTSWNNKSY